MLHVKRNFHLNSSVIEFEHEFIIHNKTKKQTNFKNI